MAFGSGNCHFDLTLYPLPIRAPVKKMKHITVNTYRKDKYYPRILRAVGKILARADVVAPSDILIETGNLSKKNYEAWRKGQVSYLERVFKGNLSKANRILRILGFLVHDLNMVSRQTVYYQFMCNGPVN